MRMKGITMSTDGDIARPGGLGPVERGARVILGGILALLTVDVAVSSTGLAAFAWLAVALLGIDFVITGLRGYCPLYARLGIGRS